MDDGDIVGALHRVREQAGGLVDGDDVRVFEEDLEGHLHRAGGGLAGRGQGDLDCVAWIKQGAAVGRLAVDLYRAPRRYRSRELRKRGEMRILLLSLRSHFLRLAAIARARLRNSSKIRSFSAIGRVTNCAR